jgi:hypothetical protein
LLGGRFDEDYIVINDGDSHKLYQPALRKRKTSTLALRHCVHKVERSSKGNNLIIQSWAEGVLIIIGVSAIFLFVLGCASPSFQIELLGLVGIAVELGQAGVAAAQKYSIFQAASVLFGLAEYLNTIGDWVGLTSLSLLMIVSTCFVPFTSWQMWSTVHIFFLLDLFLWPFCRRSSWELRSSNAIKE